MVETSRPKKKAKEHQYLYIKNYFIKGKEKKTAVLCRHENTVGPKTSPAQKNK